jgi:hypothetical protein
MKIPIAASIAGLTALFFNPTLSFVHPGYTREIQFNRFKEQKIQVAILLDVSNSMDGLIAQAKTQLWNMASLLGKAKCEAGQPSIELALYEYGRDANDVKAGYVKQISPFSTDLEGLSQKLFELTTGGGSEFCGHVIYSSLQELNWDPSPSSYKVIFIAGNEDFLQGDIQFTQSCAEAAKKGVVVNTIYCGPREQGIREHWNLGGECGNGAFTNINQDFKEEYIPSPYDSTLVVLNNRLNTTYLNYGTAGEKYLQSLAATDLLLVKSDSMAFNRRIAVKANSKLYSNAAWDLVDGYTNNKDFLKTLDKSDLPDSLRNKSTEQLEKIIKAKSAERSDLQKQITEISNRRDSYVAAEQKRRSTANQVRSLQSEIEDLIKQQVKRFNMKID